MKLIRLLAVAGLAITLGCATLCTASDSPEKPPTAIGKFAQDIEKERGPATETSQCGVKLGAEQVYGRGGTWRYTSKGGLNVMESSLCAVDGTVVAESTVIYVVDENGMFTKRALDKIDYRLVGELLKARKEAGTQRDHILDGYVFPEKGFEI